MKFIKYSWMLLLGACAGLQSCTDLDEQVYDRIDAGVYYEDEASVQGAVASIYSSAITAFPEYFWYLNELSADQIAWRTWNGGAWGWDEAEKFVLSTHTWNSESKIINQAWSTAWTTIGLCNLLVDDLNKLGASSVGLTDDQLNAYIAEVRTLRAWAYYNNFELWGGALPLNISSSTNIPGSADPDFDKGCKIIYEFIANELDETWEALPKEDGSNATRNRMNQAVNRMLKARLLLNAKVFIGEEHYNECATICQDIIDGVYGTYSLANDFREIFNENNNTCSEVIMAFAYEDGQRHNVNMRGSFLPYNYNEYFGAAWAGYTGWNCTCLVPSFDNAGTIQEYGGTTGADCFLDAPYNDKLGAVYERFDDRDIRKQNFVYDANTGWNGGIFLRGEMRAAWGTGDYLLADADRQDKPLAYVDQVGTFLGLGRPLETVMSPRWGETNSGVRLVKYPVYPEGGVSIANIDEVEFRLSEAYYMLAECKMRANDAPGAKALVNKVRDRYFTDKSALETPGRGFAAFDMDWMLSQWGTEFICEGRRRRTDLRRFDKFTQGQWWFFGRASEADRELPKNRDRKYEWFPLPETALRVNPGLVQNPNY